MICVRKSTVIVGVPDTYKNIVIGCKVCKATISSFLHGWDRWKNYPGSMYPIRLTVKKI